MSNNKSLTALLELARRGTYATYAVGYHPGLLQNALKTVPDEPLLLPVFPMRAVALIESHFAGQFARLCNRHPECLERLSSRVSGLKLDLELAGALYGGKFTMGELIAHHLNYSDIETIVATMTTALDTDFPKLVRDIRFSAKGDKIFPDWNSNFPLLKELFRLRHVFAHELGVREKLSKKRLEPLLFAATRFVHATEVVVQNHFAPFPLNSWDDHNRRSKQDADEVRKIVEEFIVRCAERLPEKVRGAFNRVVEARRAYIDAEGRLSAEYGVLRELAPARYAERERGLLEEWASDLGAMLDGLMETEAANAE
jgi:hypothetical protein